MPGTLILGAQWGDEAKGKITDILASKAGVVARYGGGDNAGHTIVVGDETYKLHLIPSGILYPKALCVMGNGVVINPGNMIGEMDALAVRGLDVSPEHLKISRQAHIVMPFHVALDGASEAALGDKQIGTTKRGIGPAYTDKAARSGLRMLDMLRPDFRDRVIAAVQRKNIWLRDIYCQPELDVEAIADEFEGYARRLGPHITDTSLILHNAYRAGTQLLYEGAQGTLLDIDHGTYPFVTSSSCASGGAVTGLGIGPQCLDRIIGVVKAYQTRVGAGAFPTELLDDVGDHMVDRGHEYGTTTGRRRRTGWLDLVSLRFSARVNGLQEIALTKLDVLSGIKTLKTCNSYLVSGAGLDDWPPDGELLQECQPVYAEMPGWDEDITQARKWAELPASARAYIAHIEETLEIPVTMISVGPGRKQTIYRGA